MFADTFKWLALRAQRARGMREARRVQVLKAEVSRYGEGLQELHEEYNREKARHLHTQASLLASQTRTQELHRDATNLQVNLQKYMADCSGMRVQIAQKEAKIAQLEKNLAAKGRDEIGKRCVELENEGTELRNQINALQSQLRQSQDTVRTVSDQLRGYQRSGGKDPKLSSLEEKYAILQADHELALEKIKKLTPASAEMLKLQRSQTWERLRKDPENKHFTDNEIDQLEATVTRFQQLEL